jgi:hypothetical protein
VGEKRREEAGPGARIALTEKRRGELKILGENDCRAIVEWVRHR